MQGLQCYISHPLSNIDGIGFKWCTRMTLSSSVEIISELPSLMNSKLLIGCRLDTTNLEVRFGVKTVPGGESWRIMVGMGTMGCRELG
jgi:hypothetical protein